MSLEPFFSWWKEILKKKGKKFVNVQWYTTMEVPFRNKKKKKKKCQCFSCLKDCRLEKEQYLGLPKCQVHVCVNIKVIFRVCLLICLVTHNCLYCQSRLIAHFIFAAVEINFFFSHGWGSVNELNHTLIMRWYYRIHKAEIVFTVKVIAAWLMFPQTILIALLCKTWINIA